MRAADVLFTGGDVYTCDAARRCAQAVAVTEGRIVCVGTDADVRGLVGPRTRVVDLRGRMLVPGFQDAHAHPLTGGLERLQCDLTGVLSAEGYGPAVRRYADLHPELEWILGGGWYQGAFPPEGPAPRSLDAWVADRPVLLASRDHHTAWVNARALELAGVGPSTADPPHGHIFRDASGEPTGLLGEGAVELVQRAAPQTTLDALRKALREAEQYMFAFGVTGWNDAWVGAELMGIDTFPVYAAAAAEGTLNARVTGSLWWRREGGEEQLDEFAEKRRQARGRFSADAVKIMQDGMCIDFTAALTAPYLESDGSPGTTLGPSFIDPGLLKRFVTRLDGAGFQVHFHAIGDRAVREALDAVQTAQQSNGLTDLRHHIAHAQVVHPDDLQRFRDLRVVANVQPLWACLDPEMSELTLPLLGVQRGRWQFPFASFLARGVTLAGGSDWPVSTANPLLAMQVAVTRRPAGEYAEIVGDSVEAFLPEQAIDVGQAIAAYTVGSAYVNHLDQEVGTIEMGKLADLVVLERNLFACEPDEIGDVRVLMTMIEGQVVHEDPAL